VVFVFLVTRQVDVAPTIAEILGFSFPCDGKPISKIIEFSKGCNRVVLLIVDSLGFNEYIKHRRFFKFVSKAELSGLLFKCLTYSRYTTPSIATLLCGLPPEKHHVWKTEDAYKSTVKNVLVVASKLGYRTAVIMEKLGALSFQNRVKIIRPIENILDIKKFDAAICSNTISVIESFLPNLVVAHLRTLDKLGFNHETTSYIDSIIEKIAKKSKHETLILLCGDLHHTKQQEKIP